MSRRARIAFVVVALAVAAGWALPGSAAAHAYLVRTVPAASVTLDRAPANVRLTFDEAVEPKFAIVSVTDASGRQQTTGPPQRSAADPDTLVTPLEPNLPQGWYLVYWRAISVDGHPVSGAFTFAIGPNPGPAPQFPIPKISATAKSPKLIASRWVMFLCVMAAIGLFVLRFLIARPMRRAGGTASSCARLSIAFVVATVAGPDRDPGLPRHLDRRRLAARRVRLRRAVPVVPGDGVRARLRRPVRLFRAVQRRELDRAVGRSLGRGATVGGGVAGDDRGDARRRGRAGDPRHGRSRRPAAAARRFDRARLGPPDLPARSGSAG